MNLFNNGSKASNYDEARFLFAGYVLVANPLLNPEELVEKTEEYLYALGIKRPYGVMTIETDTDGIIKTEFKDIQE